MSKFKVGDRVAVYSRQHRGTGQVVQCFADGLEVVFDSCPDSMRGIRLWHPKQCRKLVKKKERRRVWVAYNDDASIRAWNLTGDLPAKEIAGGAWTEFVEVRKKR